MKNYVKAIVTFVFLIAAVTFVPAISDAAIASLGAPGGLKQIDASESSVKFSWDVVIGAKDYAVSFSDGVTWSQPERVWTGTDETIYSLSAGKTYYVRVYALDDDNNLGAPSADLEVVTAPRSEEMGTATVTDKTASSISLSWMPASGATSYVVKDDFYKRATFFVESATPSATITDLLPDQWYGVDVFAVRTSSSGFKAYSNGRHHYIETLEVVVAPGKPSTSNFTVYSASASAGTTGFYVTDPNRAADGYELEVYKVSGNKKVFAVNTSSSSVPSRKFGKNTPYKYRIRYYAQSGVNRLYGPWSDYRYFWLHNVSGKRNYKLSSSNCSISMKWSKVAGATSYTVSMSTSQNGKYKKVKTLGKNARSIKITKFGKSKLNRYKTYYLKVTANVKSGKKTLKNDAQTINRTLN